MEAAELAMRAAAGLAIFLFALTMLADELHKVAGEPVKRWIERATERRARAIGIGAVATAVLDSSSGTIIIVIGMLEAGLFTLERAIGIAMGANIGTAFGSQVIALQITSYSGAIVLAGFIARVVGRRHPRVRAWASIVFAIGLVLFGLQQMAEAAAPLKGNPKVVASVQTLKDPINGALVGAILTAIIQSSSATVGMAVVLAAEGVISLPVGAAVMLGAEVGTCLDVLIASIGRSRETLRLGLWQLLFNVTAAAIGLLLLPIITLAATALSSEVPRQIAHAQLIFNLGSVLLFAPFVPWIVRALERLVPPRQHDQPACI